MGLERYHKKRDFGVTPEPKGKARKRSRSLSFVVQKHDASRLHYDFRLEWEGVLMSWAVPKGPSLDPAQKRLAVHVEDHPLDYGDFEGTIPKGQYGAGTVEVWDRGTWTPAGDPTRGLSAGKLEFELNGEKLQGSWALVRMRSRGADDDRNWLLIKHKDDFARPEREFDVARERPESVLGKRRSARTAQGKTAKKKRTERGARRSPRAPAARTPADPGALDGARRARLPAWIEPQLATLVDDAPEGDDWLHETKFDGYRALCRIERGRARWLTRSGKDWTAKFAALSPAVLALPLDEALLDGEVVVLQADGTTSFQALQNAFRGGDARLTYCVFDCLHLDGHDLRGAPLHARKELLASLLSDVADPAALRYSEHIRGEGERMLRAACSHHLEGIVSKRNDATYVSGRGRDWLKSKCSLEQEFVVGGFSAPAGSRAQFGALLLGYHAGKALRYAGRVGTGFDDASLKSVRAKLRALERDEPPFSDPPRGADARGVRWVAPNLVAAVRFTGWTEDGLLRHPAFLGLREDKPAREVVRERPARGVAALRARAVAHRTARVEPRAPKPAAASGARADPEVAGVRISHPERVLYPATGLTKLGLARYYASIADHVLPHVAGRPLNLLRCPEGVAGQCFFQRHGHTTLREPVKSVRLGAGEPSVYVDSLPGLVMLVQMGVLELHPWGARVDRPEKPDRVVFDLDPDPSVPWKRVVAAARLMRTMLEKLELECFLKTTGGKGLHVVVPLARRHTWDQVKAFSRGVAETLARAAPDEFVATASKSRRKGRIFVDWLRNTRGASSVAAFSTRARPEATVSTPIAWDELGRATNARFDVDAVLARLARSRKDPWSDLDSAEGVISPAALRSVSSRAR